MGAAIDLTVAAVRGAVFVTSLQAAGAALFMFLFRRHAASCAATIVRLTAICCGLALVLIAVRSALEPARMAGALSGMLDPFLRSLFWESDISTAQVTRLCGLALIVTALRLRAGYSTVVSLAGVALVVASFSLMGHTRAHAGGAVLGALLAVHLLAVSYWFGALIPLLVCARRNSPAVLGELLSRFSALAVRLVPLLIAAGLGLAWILLGAVASLGSAYGLMLSAKLAVVLALLGLAALNKYRLSPAVLAGDARALTALRRSIVLELGLMVIVLFLTAFMTTLFSPE